MKRGIAFRIFLLLTALQFGAITNCLAQAVPLKNLSKIELITAGAWIDSYYKRVEVVSENGVWKSYRTRLANGGYTRGGKRVNDSTRTFLRKVSADTLKQFLTLIATPDSVVRDELFDIKTDRLIAQIDTNTANMLKYHDLNLTPPNDWKKDFIETVKYKPIVSKALYAALHPMLMDDRSHYYIIVTNKFNQTDTVEADVNGEPYYLPWRLKGKESYNPNITKLFELIGGNHTFEQAEQKNLYYQIISELYYYNTFKAKLDWDRFKTGQPDVYAQASKTLIPLKFSNYNEGTNTPEMGYRSVFLSKQLPSYIEFSGSFSKLYPIGISNTNNLEQRLVAWYNNGSFLFDYIKDHPNAAVAFGSSLNNNTYNEIIKRYPDIRRFEQVQLQQFSIIEGKDYSNTSLWLLLPDDNIILMRYNGKLTDNYQSKFELIPAKRYERSVKNVCIVFNKYGKMIGGDEKPYEIKSTR